MSVKRWIRRSYHRQRRASWTVGVPQGKRGQVADFHITRRNTDIPEVIAHSFSTPTSTHSPATPKSATSLTDITEEETSSLKFKFPYSVKRRATLATMSKSRSNPNTNSLMTPPIQNGHIRTRHLSTGSSNQSDDPEFSITDKNISTSNFFDYDEDANDLYVASPEEHIHNMRLKEKIKGK